MEVFIGILVILVPIGVYSLLRLRKENEKEVPENLSLSSRINEADYEARVIEVASRAALADHIVEDGEVSVICAIASGFVPGIVSPTQIREMVEYVRNDPDKTDFIHIGTGLDDPQRQQLLRLAMQVIGKDGLEQEAGKEFIEQLSMGLLILPEQRETIAATVEHLPRLSTQP